MMSLDSIVHNRTIYNVFDWLGDIGGLLGILGSIGGILFSTVTYFFGNKMDMYLMRNLFKYDPPDVNDDPDDELVSPIKKKIETLSKRKPL